jgi:hypothetical protein
MWTLYARNANPNKFSYVVKYEPRNDVVGGDKRHLRYLRSFWTFCVLLCYSFGMPYFSGLTSSHSEHNQCSAKWRFLQWLIICPTVLTNLSPWTHRTQFSDVCRRWIVFSDERWQLNLSGSTDRQVAILSNGPGTEFWHATQRPVPG